VKPSPFVYHAPQLVTEAIELLDRFGDDGRILAGGQSLVPMMAFRIANPTNLIDINRISALDHLGTSGDELAVGALTRHAAFHLPVVAGPLGVLLASVVRQIAHVPIRTRGTFCGSLAHADPASEWCMVAATLGATIVAAGKAGRRDIPAAEFFQGIMTTAARERRDDRRGTAAVVGGRQQVRLLRVCPAPWRFRDRDVTGRIADVG
jgi:carbon-monoxide dehydrogenase medium subunit